jgi:hypothetical protein
MSPGGSWPHGCAFTRSWSGAEAWGLFSREAVGRLEARLKGLMNPFFYVMGYGLDADENFFARD